MRRGRVGLHPVLWVNWVLWVIWGLTAGMSYSQPSPAPASRPGVHVLTAADLAQAGVMRLSDLFSLIDDWYALSIDGYTWRAAPNVLAPPNQAAWTVSVDGHVLEATVFDAQNINLVPVHPARLDSVVVVSVPAVVGGRLAQAGSIHLYTKHASGAGATGSYMAGNEIDDPGPYSFTDRATRNVDRLGPNYAAGLSYGRSAFHLRASVQRDQQHVTKPPLWQRVFDIYGRPHPKNRIIGQTVSLLADLQHTHSAHFLAAGYSRLQDYRWLDPLGLEVTTEQKMPFVSLHGRFGRDSSRALTYAASYRYASLGEWANRRDHAFDWTQDHGHAHVGFAYAVAPFRFETGLSADAIRSHTSYVLADPAVLTARLYHQMDARPLPGWHQTLAAFLTHTGGAFGLEGLAVSSLRLSTWQTLYLTASFAVRPAASANSLWYWVDQGYQFPLQNQTSLSLPDELTAPRTTTLDLAWEARLDEHLAFTLSGMMRRFAGVTNLALDFGRIDGQGRLRYTPSTVSVESGLAGQVWRASAGLHHRLLPSLDYRLHYAYQHVTSGDSTFVRTWQHQPAHMASAALRYTPFPRFSLHARLNVQSATEWPGYRLAAAAPEARYRAHLPPIALLDLTVHKRFWRDYLQLTLSVRNALNAPHRTHAAAPPARLTFFVQLLLNLHR